MSQIPLSAMPSTPSAPVAAESAIDNSGWYTAGDNYTPGQTSVLEDYRKAREDEQEAEAAMAFDNAMRTIATPAEKLAHRILVDLKKKDDERVFKNAKEHMGYHGQKHKAFAGDHFLTNVDLIKETDVFAAAQHMPKGAHLHIHFNACLAPMELLRIASQTERMFIMSTLPLVNEDSFDQSEITFQIMSVEKVNDDMSAASKTKKKGNLLAADYMPGQYMPFKEFLDAFPKDVVKKSAMDWLVSKLEFNAPETYDIPQTASGAWELFNVRTRMMKGLFNYETAYTKYIKLFLKSLLDDNIQYAEIRPNFMQSNQVWKDDGTKQLDNRETVDLIVAECDKFQRDNENFDGIKIIYCTPRSFNRDQVRIALDECLDFKIKLPKYIAGFDLVGEESKGNSLNTFVPDLLNFQSECAKENVDIPFLFHCGETLDKGTSVDGNLYDALLLKSKRIGHGFALPNHPRVMQKMKERNVCVEVCPISNEILGLTPRISGHAVYNLLANNVPCTVASDNGTLFRSTLSHDFYQVLIGKPDMGLYGWRRLAEWSLEHACLKPEERKIARKRWLDKWRDYIVWLLTTYGDTFPETSNVLAEITKNKTSAANEFVLP